MDFTRVIDIIYHTGQNLKLHFGKINEYSFKSDNAADIVTNLDLETEEFIEDRLKKLDSTIGFKGEEYGVKHQAERMWLVDPIDGSGLFVRGLQGCTTMLALIEEGEISFSVIYDFILDELYHAQKGKGAFKNKARIHVSNRGLKNALIYFEMDPIHKENLPIFVALNSACVVMAGYPAGIHFAQTSCGKAEGRIVLDGWGKDYDFAPGQLLVKEAGGIVANIGTNSFNYKNLNHLAVNKEVYKELTSGENPIFPIKF